LILTRSTAKIVDHEMVKRRGAERRIETRGYGEERRCLPQAPRQFAGNVERRNTQRRVRDRRTRERRRSGALDLLQ
jgi:outer membrane protein OmpA-like peptidoglycan-associated protein